MSLLDKLKRSFNLGETLEDAHWRTWFDGQQRKLEANEEIEPPWIAFPDSLPLGWNQGYQQEWKNNVWLVFWGKLNETEKKDYLNRWQPPSADWHETVTVYWVGDWSKLNKESE